ncbi:uncharacterized protein VTP21DRAFT_9606 [Calcarisporiella thermophila]|uniref:uncharacterized protein n=1 Tax=Calcarisporiella thermophila TaxID=911321 RepID=UPI0037426CE7
MSLEIIINSAHSTTQQPPTPPSEDDDRQRYVIPSISSSGQFASLSCEESGIQPPTFPEADICQALTYELTPLKTMVERFRRGAEAVHLCTHFIGAALAAEQSKRGGKLETVETWIYRFGVYLELLSELARLAKLRGACVDSELNSVQQEWKEMLARVDEAKRGMQGNKQRKDIENRMNAIEAQLHGLEETMGLFRENRREILPHSPTSTEGNSHHELRRSRDDLWLMHIDEKAEPLYSLIDYVYSCLTAPDAPSDPEGVLAQRYTSIQKRWELMKQDLDELRERLKEDRWVEFFFHVTHQVDVMMDSVQASVDRFKRMLRTKERGEFSKEAAYAFVKGFDAKRCFYSPAIERMVVAIGSSINAKGIKHAEILRRERAVCERWRQLKSTLDEIQMQVPKLASELSEPMTPSPPRHLRSGLSHLSPNTQGDSRLLSPSLLRPRASTIPQYERALSACSLSRSESRSSMSSVTSTASTTRPRLRSRAYTSIHDRPRWNSSTKIDAPPKISLPDRPVETSRCKTPTQARVNSRARTPTPRTPTRTSKGTDKGCTTPKDAIPSLSVTPTASSPSSRATTPTLGDGRVTPTPSYTSRSRVNSNGKISMIPRPVRRVSTCSTASESNDDKPAFSSNGKNQTSNASNKPTQPFSGSAPATPPHLQMPDLDREVTRILQSLPITVPCTRVTPVNDGEARYQFSENGRSMLCRLVHRNNRVLVRDTIGWMELEGWLLQKGRGIVKDIRNQSMNIG